MRFLLTTLGSLGDLHPYIAVGKGLQERGHAVTLATSEIYRTRVDGEGLNFQPLRPDLSGVIDNPEAIRKAVQGRKGTEYIIRKMFLPWLEQGFEDTLAAARDADLIVGHPIAYGTPIAAEVLGKPWVSVALAPISMFSAEDPPAVAGAGFLEVFRKCGPGFWRIWWNFVRLVLRTWSEPVYRLRAKLGLPAERNPLVDGTLSPFGTQAWFSKVLAPPQRDWPAHTTQTGFPFYDRREPGSAMSTDLRAFLDAGPPPVVFTLGSSAVFDAGPFYEESLKAARIAGVRAILLTGSNARNRPSEASGHSLFVAEYAPYSELLPHAVATVHQGGVGTTAQALRSGRPMIVVPFSNDQPDNARRVAKLGVARVMPRRRYRADLVARELRELLAGSYADLAKQAARAIACENGVLAACQSLEATAAQSGV
jgi:UDP:flavonoid glycosyltransferase YjiC (YdhE family)